MIERWYIGFTSRPRQHWFDLFTHRDYRHVVALRFDPVCGVWIYYDVAVNGTVLQVYPQGSKIISAVIAEVPRWLAIDGQAGNYRFGLWRLYCVPAVKSLIGLRSCALRPKALYRDLVKAGAVPAFV